MLCTVYCCFVCLFLSFMYQVIGKIVGEGDLVSSALSLHPVYIKLWFHMVQYIHCKYLYVPLFVYAEIIKY